MIVAAGGGERDPDVDALVMARARGQNDPLPMMNELLSSELRPTLFLAQLSNLMAGNISIVHKVTGSSRTFMGEESAGISAVQVAAARIRAGQSRICLVGGAFSAARKDLLVNYELGGYLLGGEWRPVPARTGEDAGFVPGSVGAFLVLEDAEHARARGATAYGRLSFVAGDRGPRGDGRLAERLGRLLDESGVGDDELLVLSGATGISGATGEEISLLTVVSRTRLCGPTAAPSATRWRRSFRRVSRSPRFTCRRVACRDRRRAARNARPSSRQPARSSPASAMSGAKASPSSRRSSRAEA